MQTIDPSKMTEKESFLWHLGKTAYQYAIFWRALFMLSLVGNAIQCAMSFIK